MQTIDWYNREEHNIRATKNSAHNKKSIDRVLQHFLCQTQFILGWKYDEDYNHIFDLYLVSYLFKEFDISNHNQNILLNCLEDVWMYIT